MRTAGSSVHGARVRALVVILWRAGLRITEALTLAETDLEPRRGSILVRAGKGGKRREVGMDEWAGSMWSRGARFAGSCRSGRFCASLTAPLVAVPGRRPARGLNCGVWRLSPAFAAALLPSAPPCARGRDGARGGAAPNHPTAAPTCPPRRHQHLPAEIRHERDHQHHPRATTADGSRQARDSSCKPQAK